MKLLVKKTGEIKDFGNLQVYAEAENTNESKFLGNFDSFKQILEYYDGDDAFIVEWDKDTASFILTDTEYILNVSFDNFYPDKDLEVIGNIHENPELLEINDVD